MSINSNSISEFLNSELEVTDSVCTEFINIRDVGTNRVEMDSDILDNSDKSSVDRDMTVSKHTHKISSSITVSSGTEFSFGQEISIEASGKVGLPLVTKGEVKTTAKLVAGQKFSSSRSVVKTEEKTIEYGGGVQRVKAGKILKVSFVYEESQITGTAKIKRPIKICYLERLKKVAVNYWDGESAVDKEYLSFNNTYDIFDLIRRKKNGLSTANLFLEYRSDKYTLPTYSIYPLIEFDDVNKIVYLKEEEADFKISIGRKIVQTISDGETGEAYYRLEFA
ncbi:hypothetical protein [Serratia sp. NA_13]|uniref:hypothetical protein n=1 Tax=Serratia sp. NA_13 TaxID=3415658 RepID=UPI004046F221